MEGKNPIQKPGKDQLRGQEESSITEAKEVKRVSRITTGRGKVTLNRTRQVNMCVGFSNLKVLEDFV